MANSEIKVTIEADNKQFLKAIKECTDKIKDFTSAAGKIEFVADDSVIIGTSQEYHDLRREYADLVLIFCRIITGPYCKD